MEAYERIEKATAEAEKAIEGVKPEHMDQPTPCSDFNVKELLNHVIAGMDMLKTAATGGKATPPEGNIVSDDPAAQYKEKRQALLGVLKDGEVFNKTWSMPFGDLPGAMMAGIAYLEHLTHAWDIRKATGQPAELPEDLVKDCFEFVKPMDQMLRMPGVCGPVVEVPESAPLTDRFVGFMGRQP